MEIDWQLVGYVALIVWVLGMPLIAADTLSSPVAWIFRVFDFLVASSVFLIFGLLVGLILFA